jgi:CheY-like chemotaxis protein
LDDNRKTVIIVDDDSEFVEVVRLILENDGSWEITNTFDSLQSLYASYNSFVTDSQSIALDLDLNSARSWSPDLLIMDVFASNAPATTAVPLTGLQVSLALRDIGLQFGTLIISSMDSPSLLRMVQRRHKDGWAYLVKSADLNSADILKAAHEALLP